MHSNDFVSEYHNADHKRLDLILRSLIDAIKEEKSQELQQSLFYLFKSGLLRHIHWEENVLFPMFDREVATIESPTKILTAEHGEMNLVLISIEDNLDNKIDLDKVVELAKFLEAHNVHEDRVVYPAMKKLLDTDDRDLIAVTISRDFK